MPKCPRATRRTAGRCQPRPYRLTRHGKPGGQGPGRQPGDAGCRVTGLGRLGHYVGDRHPRRDAGRDAGHRLRDPAVGARAAPQRVQAIEVDEEGLIRLRRIRVRLRPDRHTAGLVPAVDVHKARRVLVIIVECPAPCRRG